MNGLSFKIDTSGKDKRIVATHIDHPGDDAVLDLKYLAEGLYAATHTGVPKAMEGKGVGSALFDEMVVLARNEDFRVRPDCPFIAAKFKRKSQTRDVLAEA